MKYSRLRELAENKLKFEIFWTAGYKRRRRSQADLIRTMTWTRHAPRLTCLGEIRSAQSSAKSFDGSSGCRPRRLGSLAVASAAAAMSEIQDLLTAGMTICQISLLTPPALRDTTDASGHPSTDMAVSGHTPGRPLVLISRVTRGETPLVVQLGIQSPSVSHLIRCILKSYNANFEFGISRSELRMQESK